MAELTGKAISELPESTTVNDAALVALSENGASKKMTLATLVGNLLKKTGGTMTGNVIFASGNELRIRAGFESNGTYDTNQYAQQVVLSDSEGQPLGLLRNVHYSGGNETLDVLAWRRINGTNYYNTLQLGIGPSGEQIVSVTHPAKWRSALGLCYAANETYSATSVQLAGYISANSREVSFTVPVEKSMENISSVSVTTLTGLFRTHNGFVDNVSSSASWLSDYTVSAYKRSNNLVQILVGKSSALANVTPNTVATASVNITLKFT